MAIQQQVAICDMQSTDVGWTPTPRGARCDRIAVRQCSICGEHVCKEHVKFKLVATVSNLAPPKNLNQSPPTEWVLPNVSWSEELAICNECHWFMVQSKTRNGQPPPPMIEPSELLRTALAAFTDEVRAARATYNLTDTK
jgi:hypothetical protein